MYATLLRQLDRRGGFIAITIALAILGLLCLETAEFTASPLIPWIPLGIASALVLRFGRRFIYAYGIAVFAASLGFLLISPAPVTPTRALLELALPSLAGMLALVTFATFAHSSRAQIGRGGIDIQSAAKVFLLATPASIGMWTIVQAESLWIMPIDERHLMPLLVGAFQQWLGILAVLPITLALIPNAEGRMTYSCHCERRSRVQLGLLSLPLVVYGFHATGAMSIGQGYAILTIVAVTVFAWVAINSGWLASSMASFIYILSMAIAESTVADIGEAASGLILLDAGLAVFAITAATLIGAVTENQFRQSTKLQDQYATVDTLVRAVDAMTFQLDLAGTLRSMNDRGRSFAMLSGGQPFPEGVPVTEVFRGRLLERIQHGLREAAENRRTEFDLAIDAEHHTRRFLAAIVTPLHDQHERVRGCSVVLMDLSRRRRRELARRKADRRKLKSLAEAVVHDVNNLTMAIGGTASLARAYGRGEDIDRILEEIERTCEDAANRAERLRHRPQRPTAEDLVDLSELVQSISTTQHASGRINVVSADVTDGLRVSIPPRFARFALQEILQNAIDASPGRVPSIFVACRISTTGNVLCQIRDDGPGIPPHLADQIGSGIVSTKGGGRGFGLRAIQTGIEAAGGRFLIRSSDTGTSITIELPCQLEPDTLLTGA